jgi:membrane-associated phospholipid phosphatase
MGGGHYASAYGGMLEPMYGGVGGEWLYRPWQSRFALGVDVNHVQQRDFKQNLGFRDYAVNTGHATLYWDTGWNDLQVNLSAGQYLAGDAGATLDVKRVFSNGVALGAWATKTNVSAEQFGEGSFDKGIYVRIPFDVLSPRSSAGSGTIVWNPLTRDGGARLGRSFALYDLTQQRDRRAWGWKSPAKSGFTTAHDQSYVLGQSDGSFFDETKSTTLTLGQQIGNVPASTWLWAGGAILASSLLDKEVDRRSTESTGGSGNALGTATNAVPYAMALGAGLLYTGIASESAAATAGTALSAAAYTLGANLATRYIVGRSRPYEEMGASNFNGFNSAAVRSGFASSHVAIAFALATPFAQQYDMPWLYAAAASTAIGRVQSREHWLSDTVAGAFIGYTMGSMLSEQQLGRKRNLRFSATPQSVEATWSF